MKKTLFIVTVLLLVAAFGISAFMVGNYLLDGKKQADRMDDLSQIVSNAQTETTEETEAATEGTTETTAPRPTTAGGMLPGYKDIYDQNNDTVGWIKMEGTKMNYPVLQTPVIPTTTCTGILTRSRANGAASTLGATPISTSPAITSPSSVTTWRTAVCSPA